MTAVVGKAGIRSGSLGLFVAVDLYWAMSSRSAAAPRR
jgi:hypothetical protein